MYRYSSLLIVLYKVFLELTFVAARDVLNSAVSIQGTVMLNLLP